MELITVEIAASRIEITPVRVKDLAVFVRTIEPVATALSKGYKLDGIGNQIDHLIDAVAIGAGVEREWLEERDLAELTQLACAVVEVNADFFAARVAPALFEAANRISVSLNHVTGGMTGSPDSFVPDSTTPR